MRNYGLHNLAALAPDDEGAGGNPAGEGEPPEGANPPDPNPPAAGDPAPEVYRPEGLAENLIGKTDRETIDLISKAHKGALGELSKRGRETVPKDASGYTIEAAGDDDAVGNLLAGDQFKGMLDSAKTAAHAHGLSQEQFDGFVRDFVAGNPENFVTDEQAISASAEAEHDALVQMFDGDAAKAQGVMDYVLTMADQFVQNGLLSSEKDADGLEKPGTEMFELLTMTGTAEGMHVMSKILHHFTGKQIVPAAGMTEGALSKADATEAHRAALAMPDGPEKTAAIKKAEKDMERAFGTQPAGSSIRVA